jgi:hypothetical protein
MKLYQYSESALREFHGTSAVGSMGRTLTGSGGADYFATALAVADFNGDGKPDLVVANPADGRVTMMLNPIVLGN